MARILDNCLVEKCGECPNCFEGLLHCGENSPYINFCHKRMDKQVMLDTIDPSCPLKEVEVIECAEAGIMVNTEKDHNVGPVKFYYDIEEIIIVKKQVAVSTPVK